MEHCDVLIIGGGPAGSSCAWALRHSGLYVWVADRKRFPRDKVCAGWVTPQVIEALDVDLDLYRQGRICQPITGFRTGLIGGKEVFTSYARPVSYGIRRCEFDTFLLDRCEANRREELMVSRLDRDGDGWIVNGSIHTRMLVGAGGHFCPVARTLGSRQDDRMPVVAAQEIEFQVSEEDLARGSIDPEVPELYFCNDLSGYGWCFRKGNYLNIGLGRTDHAQLSSHVRAFVDFLRDTGKVKCDVPAKFHGHAYRLYDRTLPLLCDDAVMLIGDAAGLAYPQSGEGIRPAVESGLLAAEAILDADGDYAAERLAEYSREIQRRFGVPRRSGIADWLPAAWLRAMAANMMASHWFARDVVIDRWFLHRREPTLKLMQHGVHSPAGRHVAQPTT